MIRVPIIITGILVVCATVVYWLPTEERQRYYESSHSIVGEPEPLTVIVARHQLQRGMPLRPGDFRQVKWPAHKVPRRAVTSLAGIEEFYARRSLPEGVPLVLSDVTRTPVAMKARRGKKSLAVVVDSRGFSMRRNPPGTKTNLSVYGENGRIVLTLDEVKVLSVIERGIISDTSSDTRSEKILRSGKTVELEVTPSQKKQFEALDSSHHFVMKLVSEEEASKKKIKKEES